MARPLPSNLPALTSVRFLLALGVVIFHYHFHWPAEAVAPTGLLDRGAVGVDMFFILSGFVLTHAYRASLEAGRLDYRRFLAARIARIYPAHAATLLLVLLMVAAGSLAGRRFDGEFYSLGRLVKTIFLVQAWTPEVVLPQWNSPSWSLSAEWFAYLTFPVFAWLGLALRRRPWALLALSGVVLAAFDQAYRAAFHESVIHAQANLGILRIIPEFLYGVALYRLSERLDPRRNLAIVAALASSALVLLMVHLRVDGRLVVAAGGPLILSLALLSKAGADRATARPWMIAAGEASYALYLVHMPLLIGWKVAGALLTGRPSTYLLDLRETAGLLALTLAAAFALHYLFENPARRWIRARADRLWPQREPRLDPAASPASRADGAI